jgi:uncharacterized protein GlcG (DUF336 family)
MSVRIFVSAVVAAASVAGPAIAQGVVTTHRLSAALASEAAATAVATCAGQGYKVSAVVIDTDGVVEAMLRGDGASRLTMGAAHDKAYTALMLGGARGEAGSGDVAKRMGPQTVGGLGSQPHVLLAQGALNIRVGGEAIAAIGVGGAPGGNLDEACAKAGLDAISARLK